MLVVRELGVRRQEVEGLDGVGWAGERLVRTESYEGLPPEVGAFNS